MTGLKIISVTAGLTVLAALALAYFGVHARTRPSLVPPNVSIQTMPSAPAGHASPANGSYPDRQDAGAGSAALPGVAYAASSLTPGGVAVENGTRIRGLARSIGIALGAQGIPVSRMANFPIRSQVTTTILFSPASAEVGQALAKRLGDVPARPSCLCHGGDNFGRRARLRPLPAPGGFHSAFDNDTVTGDDTRAVTDVTDSFGNRGHHGSGDKRAHGAGRSLNEHFQQNRTPVGTGSEAQRAG